VNIAVNYYALSLEAAMPDTPSRREFSLTLASFVGFAAIAPRPWRTSTRGSSPDVTKTSEAIHQEVTLNASTARVYAALTNGGEFTMLMAFSSMKNAAPAQIGSDVGSTFSLFNGHIIGRQLELVPGRRIVQAWRVVDWPAGAYSIAKFELVDRAGKTNLIFDHTGFPSGLGEHLAQGWRTNYWEPLEKYLK
jgi:activator of HSP90 ATPase